MPAKVGESIVHADLRQAQHVGDHLSRQAFVVGARRDRCRVGRPEGAELGQGRTVHLAVGGERKVLDHADPGRHQVIGQSGAQPVPQLRLAHSGCRHVAGQIGDPVVIARGQHDGPVYRGMAAQRGLHLTELHPVATDLDLVVGAAGVAQFAVDPADQVPAAVDPAAVRFGVERRGLPPQVAAGHPRPADPQLAQLSVRYGVPRRIAY